MIGLVKHESTRDRAPTPAADCLALDCARGAVVLPTQVNNGWRGFGSPHHRVVGCVLNCCAATPIGFAATTVCGSLLCFCMEQGR
jgi:hypothetical protein